MSASGAVVASSLEEARVGKEMAASARRHPSQSRKRCKMTILPACPALSLRMSRTSVASVSGAGASLAATAAPRRHRRAAPTAAAVDEDDPPRLVYIVRASEAHEPLGLAHPECAARIRAVVAMLNGTPGLANAPDVVRLAGSDEADDVDDFRTAGREALLAGPYPASASFERGERAGVASGGGRGSERAAAVLSPY